MLVAPITKAAIIDLLKVFIIFLLLIKDTFTNATIMPTIYLFIFSRLTSHSAPIYIHLGKDLQAAR
ncbi:hypothetical protein NCCP2140_29610 [Pseudoalteromonas sp. NCCP-2140]|nr:hypothetical protein NCCP2140_29610 [Pseudoalteromonas sp. NCCP-2140]